MNILMFVSWWEYSVDRDLEVEITSSKSVFQILTSFARLPSKKVENGESCLIPKTRSDSFAIRFCTVLYFHNLHNSCLL